MRSALLAGVTVLALTTRPTIPSDAAIPRGPAPVATCAIEGWSIDRDPAGLRVRAGPSARAAVVGRLPAYVVDRDGDYGPFFRIVAARGGWLRIREANDSWRPSDLPIRPVFTGSGWVHGSMVRVAVQSMVGRAAPTSSAPVLMSTGGPWLSEQGRVMAITDCSARWAKVRYSLPRPPPVGPRNGEAWFTRICGDQRTTCDFGGRQ